MQPERHEVRIEFAGVEVRLETGRIARQASGAVLARRGDDVLLATVVIGAEPATTDFFPLTVEYREKLAAAGRIPGSFGRREGRITEHEVLQSRLIDRSIRSLFPDGYRHEVQVQITVLSAEPHSDLASLAIIGACAALQLSPAPADGPAAGLRVIGGDDGFAAFPTQAQRDTAAVDLVVSAGPGGLVMVEGGAAEVDESTCIAALEQGLGWIERIRRGIAALAVAAGTDKQPVPERASAQALPEATVAELRSALVTAGKSERRAMLRAARERLLDAVDVEQRSSLAGAFEAAWSDMVRERVLGEGRRIDGRDPEQIRAVWCEVGWLPRAHGSAVFTRGETQALVSCTLGSTDDAQRVEGLGGMNEEHFLLHYNFPPYSVGETRPLRGPGRREIGHGFLARRGLLPVLPALDTFPYTIRIDSEISESNGSSSMATACGGCLALMDAGVPIQRPVAGIAMGLVTDGARTVVLSDILGDEDHLGDMDFKVVGTAVGVTALQLDNKIGGVTSAMLARALDQARRGRLQILDAMAATLAAPREQVSRHAPQVVRTAILPDSVAALIGPRGQTIKGITAATTAQVSVRDDGSVRIYAADRAAADKALRMVGRVAGVPRTGGYYRGVVAAVRDFGCIVRLNDVADGQIGRDELYADRRQPDREFAPGDEVTVRVIGLDDRGRLRLSRRAALDVDPALIEW